MKMESWKGYEYMHVLWFNPIQQLSTRQPLTHSPRPEGWGREVEGWKCQNLWAEINTV